MDLRYRISQSELSELYNDAHARRESHPDIAEKYDKLIEEQSFFKTEKEALEYALKQTKATRMPDFQIWAKIEKIDDTFRIAGWWLVTDDWKIKQAAEYIGLAMMYDSTRLRIILLESPNIEDILAYY